MSRRQSDGSGTRPPLIAECPAVVQSLLHSSDIGVALVGPTSTVEWVNEPLETFFGFETETVTGERYGSFAETHLAPCLSNPDTLPASPDPGDGAESDRPELHVLPRDGRAERRLRYRAHPIESGPASGGHLLQFTDITAERPTLYERIVEEADDAVYVVDSQRRIRYANEASATQTDRPAASLVDAPILEVISDCVPDGEDCADLEAALSSAFATTQSPDGTVTTDLSLSVGDTARDYCFRCTPFAVDGEPRVLLKAHDVSERTARARRYETLVDNFPNGAITLVDEDLRYRLARGQLFERLATSPESVEGQHVGDVAVGDRKTFVKSYRDALAGDPVAVETDVGDRVLLQRTLPVVSDDGTIRTAIGMTQDITEQKRQAAKRRRTREFLRDIQAVADIGGWEVDLRSETVRWTDEVYHIHELSTEYEPTVSDALGFCHPDDRAEVTAAYEQLKTDGEAFDLELRIVTDTDEVRWVRALGRPWRDDDGDQVGARGTFQDITERKSRERELRRKSRALDAAPVGITITDPSQDDNPMIYVNEQFEAQTGYDRDAVLGRNCRFLQGAGTDPNTVATIRRAIDAAEPVSTELRNYRQDGTEYWNHLDIAPVSDDSGDVVNYVGFQQDVTERVARERELRETKQRLDIALEETNTGVWVLDDDTDTVSTFGTTDELLGVADDTDRLEDFFDSVHPDDRRAVEAALERSRSEGARFDIEFRVDTQGRDRWVRGRGKFIDSSSEPPRRMVGVTTDVTERKHRVKALERRERILRELHTATREFYPPSSMADIASFLVEFIENAFGFSYISVKKFDEETGTLRPSMRSDDSQSGAAGLGPVTPGNNPVWEAYREGDTRVFTAEELGVFAEAFDAPITQLLVAPVGDFGVTLAATTGGRRFDQVHIDIIDVLVANGESAFQRLRSDGVRSEIMAELSTQQARVEELQGLVDTIQSIQHRLGESDSREMLESSVCQELVATDRIDFAWIGRPRGSETNIAPVAWAGDADGYVDTTLAGEESRTLPAVRAARDGTPVHIPQIPSRVFDEPWAKDALSYSFTSVMSTPLIYDDVLYGVLTVYSATEDAFDTLYDNFVTDVSTLLVNYSRILEQRAVGSQQQHTTLEFELTGQTYPLQRLANATDSTVKFDTVAEYTSDDVRILATVLEGDADAVLAHAQSMASIDTASWFGSADHRQLSLVARRPFIATLVGKHGGRLVQTVSKPDSTTVTIELPDSVSKRPLLDSLTSRYEQIELVAQRHSADPTVSERADLTDVLTERQYEILNAAYHGGYYETPRGVNGEDLAVSFGISSPAVYNHLQAAHRRILRTVLDVETGTDD